MNDISYGERRATSELTSIFASQWSNGMLPQIRFQPGQHGYRPDADDWGVTPAVSGPTRQRTSGITQPPIIGMCAEEVFRKIGSAARQAFAGDFLSIAEGLEKFHNWLLTERDPWGENLALCLHPWETGTDNSPAFDLLVEATRAYVERQGLPVGMFGRGDTVHVLGEHRPTERDYYAYFGLLALFKKDHYDQGYIIQDSPFLLQDVLFNSLLAGSLYSLAALEERLAAYRNGDATLLRERAARNRLRGDEVGAAIRDKLWDGQTGLFYSYDCRGDRLLKTPTVSGFMPLMGGIAQPQQAGRLIAHLLDADQFWSEVPVPSTSLSSSAFNPVRYWSGPSWPVTNWLVVRGLQERGSPWAEVLRHSTLKMIAEGTDRSRAREAAMQVMEQNSMGEAFTTPSTRQYQHAWLWDSAIVAVSWPAVRSKPKPYTEREGDPGFWEYYEPRTGAPLGASRMSWTASLFVELQGQETTQATGG